MIIRFATCDRQMALDFLRKWYPSRSFSDSGKTKELLDLVQADIIRIPDPMFHPDGGIYPSNNWDESKKDEYVQIISEGVNPQPAP